MQEAFSLISGWNSAWICHHCMAHDNTYLTFPCRLPLERRRTLSDFEQLCKANQHGERCNRASLKHACVFFCGTCIMIMHALYIHIRYMLADHILTHVYVLRAGSLLRVRGFDHNMVKWCSLHTINLGIASWACGSAIFELLKYEELLMFIFSSSTCDP